MIKRVTLKDIAKEVGIASTSVSKALRDSKDISPATIKKVKSVAKEMGYYPNITARNLVSKKSYTIGALVPEILTSHHSYVVEGFYSSARKRRYEVILMVTNESQKNETHCLRYLSSLPVDGIIATATEETTDYAVFEEVYNHGVPIVFFGRCIDNTRILSVGADDYLWTGKLMDFFISKGYRKIAFLGPQGPLGSSKKKFTAYKDKLKKAGIAYDKELVVTCKINDKDGYQKAKELLKKNILPDAMLCANDMVAIGAAKAILEKGLLIPFDVALAGFGNLIETSVLNVPITTVNFDAEEMGRTVMDRLIDLIESGENEKTKEPIVLDASLIIRE